MIQLPYLACKNKISEPSLPELSAPATPLSCPAAQAVFAASACNRVCTIIMLAWVWDHILPLIPTSLLECSFICWV
eukprot:951383-Pelagomonas_calceolata.AAC.1